MGEPPEILDGMTAAVQARVSERTTPGLQLIVQNQSGVVYEYDTGFAELASSRPMQPDTTMMAYSMSKTITAAAVLQLVDAGVIQLDDPINRYVPWQPYGDSILVRHLLSHTSGIPNPIPLRWVHPVAIDADFDDHAALVTVLVHHPRLRFHPGSRFAYSNIGYWLLGEIIATVSDGSFTSYVDEHVLRPLGIVPAEMGFSIVDPSRHAAGYLEKYSLMNVFKRVLIDAEYIGAYSGRWLRIRDHFVNGRAFGGLVGTARGFGKFLQDQLQDHSRLLSDTGRALFYEQQRTTRGPIAMTLGWHIGSRRGEPFFYKEGGGGGFHCMMRLYPRPKIGMVVMTNATAFDVSGLLDACASSR